jgi:hypothetical protein
VVGAQLLGEERERGEQEDAHHDQREVFVHEPDATIARVITARPRGDTEKVLEAGDLS